MNTITPTAIVETVRDNASETIFSLQNLIAKNATRLRELKAKKKMLSEQEKSLLENNQEFQEAESVASEHIQAVKEAKLKVKQSLEAQKLKTQKVELSEEEKEIQETLSNHLVSYYSLTNSNIVDIDNGEQIQMTIKATISAKQLELF